MHITQLMTNDQDEEKDNRVHIIDTVVMKNTKKHTQSRKFNKKQRSCNRSNNSDEEEYEETQSRKLNIGSTSCQSM